MKRTEAENENEVGNGGFSKPGLVAADAVLFFHSAFGHDGRAIQLAGIKSPAAAA
jgi:hypothetical protein